MKIHEYLGLSWECGLRENLWSEFNGLGWVLEDSIASLVTSYGTLAANRTHAQTSLRIETYSSLWVLRVLVVLSGLR